MNTCSLPTTVAKSISQTLSGESSPAWGGRIAELANYARFGYSFRERQL